MANPRYAQQRPDRKAQKLEQFSQFQEGQQRQQALDQRSQAGMMEQLQQMYGLSQQQQMDPLKMDALRASTEAQGLANEQQKFQNAWAQPKEEAAYGLATAQAQKLNNAGQLTPRDYMDYEMTLGRPHPQDPQAIQAQQKAEALRLQQQRQEEDMQRAAVDPIGPPISLAPPRTTAFTGREGGIVQNPISATLDSVYTPELTAKLLAANQNRRANMTPEQIYNEQHPIDALWNAIFGKPIQR